MALTGLIALVVLVWLLRERRLADTAPLGLILGGALPLQEWIHTVGLASLWLAAGLTLVTGFDYLRTGIKHFD